MLNLSAQNIRLNGTANNKDDAIRQVAAALVANGNVAQGYEVGMLERETQTSTFLGNGIAIPHGTLDTRHLVQNTGVQIIQFPQGIEWGEGNVAYVVIGIAAKSDEHLALLRQLTSVLSDEAAASTLANTNNLEQFIATLSGNQAKAAITEDLITVDVQTQSLLTLSALNAAKLQEQGYANQTFVSEVVSSNALALGNGVWLNDSSKGNLENGVAVIRAASPFLLNNKSVQTLITVAAKDNALQPIFSRLLDKNLQQQLATANPAQLVALLAGEPVAETQCAKESENLAACAGKVTGIFTVRNDNGLHARPSAVLVQTVKAFASNITVENLDRQTPAANAKSLMKVVALGAAQGHRLRFVAEGEDAQQAINTLAQAFVEGLGESVTFVPAVEDSIESAAPVAAENVIPASPVELPENAVEAVFTIHNEHGLHARPSGMLVATVKQFQATIVVQNIDRNSPLVSAKSMMKVVSLGVTKGHRLRFVATGEDAQAAIDAIGKAIEAGLGE